MKLVFKVYGQKLVWVNSTVTIVSDSRGYLTAFFNIPSDYIGLVTAHFSNDRVKTDEGIAIPLDENLECSIPEAVIKSGTMYVSLSCSSPGLYIPTNSVKVIVQPSGVPVKSMLSPEEPQPADWAIIQKVYTDVLSAKDKVLQTAEEIANGVINPEVFTEINNRISDISNKLPAGRIYVSVGEPNAPEEGDIVFVIGDTPPDEELTIPLTDYLFRFDASELALEDGAKVAQWNDLGSTAMNLTQTTEANKPTFLTKGLNDKPTVQFANTFLENTSFVLDRFEGASFFFVGRFDDISVSVCPVSFGIEGTDSTSARRLNLKVSSSQQKIQLMINNYGLSNTPVDLLPIVMGTSYNRVINKVYKNGTFLENVAYSQAIGSANKMRFGRGLFTSALEPFSGVISEVIYFSRALTESEMSKMNAYLKQKWGVA